MKDPFPSLRAKTFQVVRTAFQLRMTEASTNRRSRRICGLAHVRSLSFLIAVMETFFLIAQGIMTISYLSSPSSTHLIAASIQSLAVVSALVSIVLLIVGLFCHIPTLLVPHMLMQVLFVLLLLLMASFTVYTLLTGASVSLRIVVMGSSVQPLTDVFSMTPMKASIVSRFLTGLIVIVAVGYVFAALFNIWCFHVVMDCYRWLSFRLEEKSRVLGAETALPIGCSTTKPVVHATDF